MLRPLLLAALAVSVAHAAPASKEKEKDAVWFPTREGDTRVYEVRDGDKTVRSYTDLVTKVETKDGAIRVTIRRDSGAPEPYTTTISVTAEGLFRVSSNNLVLDKPVQLLKTPPKVGTKWDLENDGHYEVTKEEDVEVPAGKYKAVRVELSAGDGKTTLWFAPKVGLIKMVPGGSDQVTVLKEFKPGK